MDAPIHIITPPYFDSGAAQTPGSERLAAVAPQLGVDTALWGGLFKVEPGARTGVRHHGKQQTIAYVLAGTCEIRRGDTGDFAAAAPGVPVPYEDQPIGNRAAQVSRRAKHFDPDCQSSRG
jgi:uncharacterized RmlC-like cupin family protein